MKFKPFSRNAQTRNMTEARRTPRSLRSTLAFAERLEDRTVMTGGPGAGSTLAGLLPITKVEPVKQVDITKAVPSNTEVMVAVKGDAGYDKLRLWATSGGDGELLTDFAGSKVLFADQGLKLVELKLSRPQSPNNVIDILKNESFVAWTAPNLTYNANSGFDPRDYVPNDPLYPNQWHHPLMGNTQAWDIATTFGKGVIVAIEDDGITLNQEDLAPNIWKNSGEIPGDKIDNDGNGYVDDVNGWDFADGDNNPNPDAAYLPSHGTCVAGNVAARIDNGVGLAGVAGKATLMPVRFYNYGTWTSSMIAQAYAYAVNNGAKIVNVSYNIDGFATDPTFKAALDYIYDSGVLYMNSAGNNGQLNPARGVYDQGLFVMASDPSDKLMSYSNYGTSCDVIASADPVWTTSDTGYTTFNGTSSATPVASGAMALVWGAHPTWTREQVVAQVLGTSDNVSGVNPSYSADYLGYGRINTYKALSQTLRAPRLGAITGLPAEGATVTRPVGGFTIRTANVYDPATVVDSSFEMRYAGADNTFGTSDDALLPVSVSATNGGSYKYGTNNLTFGVGGRMVPGRYRFSALSGANGLKDPFGQQLDGNGDGTAGDALTRTFTVAYQTGGVVHIDDNRDGQYQGGEKPLAGWTVFVDNNNNGILDIQTAAPQNSVDIPKPINDNATVTSNLPVSGIAGTVASVKVRLNITHTYDSDLQITLISPSGIRVLLAGARGGSGPNFTNTVFDDLATTAISAGTAPFTGSFRPDQPLSAVTGETVNGIWKLEVRDTATLDTGTLNSWGLDFKYTTEALTTTDAYGVWVMNNLAVGNYNICVSLPNTTDWAFGTPSTGKYAVSLPTVNSTAGGLNYDIIARPRLLTAVGASLVGNGGNMSFSTMVGTTSQPKTLTLYNNGAGTIWFKSITTTLPFEITTPVPTKLAPGESADINIVYYGTSTTDVQIPLQIKYLDIDPVVPATYSITLKGHTIIPSITGSYIADLNANGQFDTGETAYPGIKLYDDLNNNNAYDAGTPTVKSATGLPYAIPDGGYIGYPLVVSGITGLVGGLTVSVQATHTWSGDLAFILVNPSGIEALLYYDPADPFGTNFNVTFDDNATASIVSGTVPTGLVKPLDPLAPLASGDVNGNWYLYAYDLVTPDFGNLTSFSITFMVGAEPRATTASDGSYTFYDLPAGSNSIKAMNPPTGVYFLTPANGIFNTTLIAGQMLTGVNFVPLTPNSISGQVTDVSTGAGVSKVRVYNDANGNGQFDSQPVDRVSSTTKVAILDLKTVSKTVSVSGTTLPVYGVEVTLNITHRHLGDLTITLVSPSGTKVKLLNRDGGSGQNLVNAVFRDYADTSIPGGLFNYTGAYIPNESLAGFNRVSPNGTWTVQITDNAIGDTGWFNSFSLRLITSNEANAITNSYGFYTLLQATAGAYALKAAPIDPGWTVVTPTTGTRNTSLTSGAAVNGMNFGLKKAGTMTNSVSIATGPGTGGGGGKSSGREFYVPSDLLAEVTRLAKLAPRRKTN